MNLVLTRDGRDKNLNNFADVHYSWAPRRTQERTDGHMNGGVTDEVVPVEGEGNKRRPPFFPSHPIYIFHIPPWDA